MKTLLRLDASSQTSLSHSRSLADHFMMRWKENHPEGKIITRDLVSDPVPHLDEATIRVFYSGGDVQGDAPIPRGIAISNELIGELKEAEDILISSAVYNFTMPSALKAWIDHIVRFGHTLGLGERGPVGLLSGKRAYLITARGGNSERSSDYQYPVLQAVFHYIGIQQTHWISLEGTRMNDGGLDDRIGRARKAIDELLTIKHTP